MYKIQHKYFRPSAIRLIIAAAIVAVAAAVAIGYQHHYRSMRLTLMDLQAQNQADTVFRSDSLQLRLVHFFDRHAYTPSGLLHPARTANERLLAHYLLGRAYADMGDAPMAIQTYREATDCADTTSASCDYAVLRSVYGQMAEVFDAQDLPTEEIIANRKFMDLSERIGDTLQYLIGLENMLKPYYLMNDTNKILSLTEEVVRQFELFGRKDKAARTMIPTAYINVKLGKLDDARKQLLFINSEADIFNDDGTLKKGCEVYYWIQGSWYDANNQLDSAILYFRRAVNSGEQEAGYRGLLSVFTKQQMQDSIAKYAALYADANDAYNDSKSAEQTIRTMRLYDYGVQQKQAQANSETAARRMYVIVTCLIIMAVLLFIIRVSHRRIKQKRIELGKLSNAYLQIVRERNEAMKEVALYKEKNNEFIAVQQQKIDRLQSSITKLEAKYAVLCSEERKTAYYSSAIVEKFRHASITPTVDITESDFTLLEDLFRQCFPEFVSFVDSRAKFTMREWRVVILTDLCINPSVVAIMLETSPARVTGLKAQVNNVLFNAEGAQTMPQNLKKAMNRR